MVDLTAVAIEYQLEVEGVKFWTPYWINQDGRPYRSGRPFKGKGTPAQLRNALISSLGSRRLDSPEAHRLFMRRQGLGVDCSGFAYHMLHRFLRKAAGTSLADVLTVPRQEVEEAAQKGSWRRAGVTPQQIRELPLHAPLGRVCRLFHKSPRMLANVQRLVTAPSLARIQQVSAIRPGDMIKMTGRYGDHIAVVTASSDRELIYAESKHDESGPGGVSLQTIRMTDPDVGLDRQDWPDRSLFNPSAGDAVWRFELPL